MCTFPLWTDDEYVTGYGVQVLGWYDGDDVDCQGTTQDLRATGSVDFPNKVRFVSCHAFSIYGYTKAATLSVL